MEGYGNILKINESEYCKRIDRLREYLSLKNLTGVVLFDSYFILYFSGFAFIPTERPIAFMLTGDGDTVLFVPRLEVEHARSMTLVKHVAPYLEYPHLKHPMQHLSELMIQMGMKGNVGADQDGYPWILGYRGPRLSEFLGKSPEIISPFIEEMMAVKSEAELNLIQESVKWSNLAHTLLQRYTKPGFTETEVSLRASTEATLSMLDAIGPIYRSQSPFTEGASAGYRGQIGRNAAIPHALAGNKLFQVGDVLVSGAEAPVWGYESELERTMIIGSPNDQQKRMFDHMLNLQEMAFTAIKPGIKCSEVDQKVRKYYQDHDLMEYWKHHVGHAIGLRYHEGPFLDIGDETIIQPGMVFTVEPGLYIPELGGFRHSDTVVVTGDGIRFMTYYPRDLESLIIPL